MDSIRDLSNQEIIIRSLVLASGISLYSFLTKSFWMALFTFVVSFVTAFLIIYYKRKKELSISSKNEI